MMTKLLFVAGITASLLAAGTPPRKNISVGENDVVLSHITYGGGWSTTITLVSMWGTPAPFTLRFYGDDGAPLAVPISGLGDTTVLTNTVAQLGTRTYDIVAPAGAALVSGWAELSYHWESTVLGGMAVFKFANGSEAVVPFSNRDETNIFMPFDMTNNYKTGLAVANPRATSVTVQLEFRDENGLPLEGVVAPIVIPGRGHTSFMLDKYPQVANRRGAMTVRTDNGRVATLGIRANPLGGFTSIHSLDSWE